MKRSGPPTRKTELRSRGFRPRGHGPHQAQADTEEAAEALAAEKGRRQLVRDVVFARDRHCLLATAAAGPCFGKPLTPHHLWKAGQGGLYVPSNLVTLCGHHNDWVELEPATAKAWGLVVRNGDDIPSVWRRMHFFELVHYWWDGSPADGPMPELEAA